MIRQFCYLATCVNDTTVHYHGAREGALALDTILRNGALLVLYIIQVTKRALRQSDAASLALAFSSSSTVRVRSCKA